MQNQKRIVFASVKRVREVSCRVYKATRPGGTQYGGIYTVTPEFSAQTLATRGKSMRDDVTVEAITVSRTENLSGGNTVYIGGEIHG